MKFWIRNDDGKIPEYKPGEKAEPWYTLVFDPESRAWYIDIKLWHPLTWVAWFKGIAGKQAK